MGLDITAYRLLSKVENPELDEDGYPIAGHQWRCRRIEYTDRDFPGRAAGLESQVIYAFTDSFDFRAGSYGGYNQWRDQLARLAGYASAEDCWSNHQSGAFWELINFSDCEGVIGRNVAAKLAKDFADFKEKAAAIGDQWFFDTYCCWEKAFIMASDSGAVDFH
jgi:hypothetical protein